MAVNDILEQVSDGLGAIIERHVVTAETATTQTVEARAGNGTVLRSYQRLRNLDGENEQTIRQHALTAAAGNRTYGALAAPTAAQTTAQVKALSRQMNGMIRLVLVVLDGTD